jgi:ribonuclease HI
MGRYRVEMTFNADNGVEATAIVKAFLKTAGAQEHKFTASAPEDYWESAKDLTTVWTDGGCHNSGKDGLGAWAFLAHLPDGTEVVRSEASYGNTNNTMELRAVIEALKVLEMGPPILIRTDSEYVIKGVTLWVRNWVRNGWKTMNGTPVKNKELWEELVALYKLHNAKFEHVKGHVGHEWNEHVDELCTKAMQELHKASI